MERNLFIANRLKEVLLDGQWIANTNFKSQITSIDWRQATQKIGDLNTIAALTFHINYYLEGLIHVFEGGQLEISDKYSFDVPRIQSDMDWNTLVDRFIKNSERFVNQVKQLPEDLLDHPFVSERYGSYLRNIEGVIEHSYYHLGQVSLLKKMVQ